MQEKRLLLQSVFFHCILIFVRKGLYSKLQVNAKNQQKVRQGCVLIYSRISSSLQGPSCLSSKDKFYWDGRLLMGTSKNLSSVLLRKYLIRLWNLWRSCQLGVYLLTFPDVVGDRRCNGSFSNKNTLKERIFLWYELFPRSTILTRSALIYFLHHSRHSFFEKRKNYTPSVTFINVTSMVDQRKLHIPIFKNFSARRCTISFRLNGGLIFR